MKNIILTALITILTMNAYGQSFGNAIRLNGQTDYLTIPNNNNLNPTSTITVEAWIQPCDTTATKTILSKNHCPNNNGYSLHLRSGRLNWVWEANGDCGSVNGYTSTLALQPNVWQHVAVVHTSTSVTFYLNGNPIAGSLVNGGYSNLFPSSEPLRIGVYRNLNGNFSSNFDGFIDEVRVWNTALSAANIQARYNSQLQGNEAGLIAYYNMNSNTANGAGVTVSNNSVLGSALDATTVGSFSTPVFVAYVSSLCEGIPESVSDYFTETKVYPNPTFSEILVDFSKMENKISATVYNTSGQILLQNEYSLVKAIRLNLDFASGLYYLQLKTPNGEQRTIKILKK